ncbi:MAG: aldo/keto reductase [Scytonema sp. RU_4_4]|nr:aldo/keto reductase [Scytonema sp. RU_4_4]NJR73432.1 aldo/keto reductase [Scytonema sp. CRU_2_7]
MELTTRQGLSASILGLAGRESMDAGDVAVAFEGGLNYFFFYNLEPENFLDGLKLLLTTQREQVLVATGTQERDVSRLRHDFELVRDRLKIDEVDVFFAEYVSPDDDMTQVQTVIDELQEWKSKGLIRYVGVTTHNRAIALDIIERGACDVLMHRYNMAHRKAEENVLPNAQQAGIPVVAFTCTRWGTLLKGHPNWQHKPPQAADCYRYVLRHPAVHLALTAPTSRQQLEENLSVLHAPQLSSEEVAYWQKYGDLIYGNGQDAFETQWI